MSKTITTTVLKPHMGADGVIVQVGATITVDENRFRQLSRKGYVPKGEGDNADEGEGEAPRRSGISNADFEPRRETIIGEGNKPAVTPKAKPATKQKAKPADK